jgi:hypothetical protein
VFLQERLFIAGNPTKYLRLSIQFLNKIMDIEIYRNIRRILSRIDRRPGNVSHAMMLIHRGGPDIAHSHFFRSCRPIPLIALLHELSELIVVLPGYDPGGRGRYKRGSVERRALIQVHIAIQRAIEESLIPREQFPYGSLQ